MVTFLFSFAAFVIGIVVGKCTVKSKPVVAQPQPESLEDWQQDPDFWKKV